jgi:hypothetical protein
MPGVMDKLGEERPLGTAVALAERVQGVDVSEEPVICSLPSAMARIAAPRISWDKLPIMPPLRR